MSTQNRNPNSTRWHPTKKVHLAGSQPVMENWNDPKKPIQLVASFKQPGSQGGNNPCKPYLNHALWFPLRKTEAWVHSISHSLAHPARHLKSKTKMADPTPKAQEGEELGPHLIRGSPPNDPPDGNEQKKSAPKRALRQKNTSLDSSDSWGGGGGPEMGIPLAFTRAFGGVCVQKWGSPCGKSSVVATKEAFVLARKGEGGRAYISIHTRVWAIEWVAWG